MARGQGRGVARGQSRCLREDQPQQEPIDGPGQAARGVAAALAAVQTPAETTALQHPMQLGDLGAAQLEVLLQGAAIEQGLQGGGREPLAGQLQQLEQGSADPRLALLAAIGQAPGEVDPRGFAIAKDGGHQGRKRVHLGRHHQDVPGLQAWISSEPLQDPIPHDLHLTQEAWAGMELQGAVAWGALQLHGPIPLGQPLLQLGQERHGPWARVGGCRCEKQIPVLGLAQQALAGALEQLLKLPAQAAKAGFQAWGLHEPIPGEGLLQGHNRTEAFPPTCAALPEIGTGRQQVQIDLGMGAHRLEQLHLDRRQAAEAKQAHMAGQGAGGGRPLAELADRGLHLQAKGLFPESVAQRLQEERLPELGSSQGLAPAVHRLALPPGSQQVGPVEGVVIKGIGDRPPQLPVGQLQPVSHAVLRQPALEQLGLRLFHELGQELENRPHQLVGPPGIVLGGSLLRGRSLYQGIHNPAQLAAGEREADVGGDAAEPHGELFAEPAARGPGVDHHLHLVKGAGGGQPQLGCEQFGEEFRPVAAENGEQGVASRAGSFPAGG